MTHNLKRNCLFAVAAVAVIVGIGLAVRAAVQQPDPAHHVGAQAHAEAIRALDARAPRAPRTGTLEVAESYLGISNARMSGELRSGKTLAQIADATAGKSANGLLRTLLAARTRLLQAALANGRLSRAEVARRMARLRERVSVQLDRG